MPNYDFNVLTSVGECNTDDTRTVTFTLQAYAGIATTYEIDFDTSAASTDATGALPAGSPATATETHDYASGASYPWEVRFFNAGTGALLATKTGTVTLGGCCHIEVTATTSECNSDGTREVIVYVSNVGTSDETVTVDYDDGSSSAATTITAGSGEFFWHDYAPASSDYTITVSSGDCVTTTTVTVNTCDPCPIAAVTESIGECVDGMREISVTLTVTPSSATQEAGGTLTVGSTTVSGTEAPGVTLTLTASETAAAGSTVSYSYEITDPTECASASASHSIEVPECDGDTCPVVDIDFEDSDCVDGRREVETSATVTGSSGQAITASLAVNGTDVDSQSGTGSLTLSHTETYDASETLTATVTISEPKGCDPTTKSYTVDTCDTTTGGGGGTTTTIGDTCATNPICCWICWPVMILSSIFAFSIATAGAGIYLPYSAYVALVVGLIELIFLAWAYGTGCNWCQITKCILYGIMIALTVAAAFLALTIFGMSFYGTILQLMIMVALLGIAAFALWRVYVGHPCP